jgi:hypothetical protein
MPTYIDTVLADDFRQEVGNKISLNGVLGEEMYLPQIPTALPSLAIMQRWRVSDEELDHGIGQFSFGLELPDGKLERFPSPPTPSLQKGVKVTMMNFIFKFVGFPIRQTGEFKFRTFLNDVEMNAYKFYVFRLSEMQAARTRSVGFKS